MASVSYNRKRGRNDMETEIAAMIAAAAGLVTATGGFLAGKIRARAEARKHISEAEANVTQATLQFAESLRREMNDMRTQHRHDTQALEQRLGQLERLNEWYRRYNSILIAQLHGLKVTPHSPEPIPGESS
jgi:uncharacterized protein HemX